MAFSDENHQFHGQSGENSLSNGSIIPCILLNSTVVFPHGTETVQLRMPYNLELLQSLEHAESPIVITYMHGDLDGSIHSERVGTVGVLGRVINQKHMPDGTIQVTLDGQERVYVQRITQIEPFALVEIGTIDEQQFDQPTATRLVAECFVQVRRLIEKSPAYPSEYANIFNLAKDQPDRFADMVASVLHITIADRRQVLEAVDVIDRLTLLNSVLRNEIVGQTMAEELSQRARTSVEQHQRQVFLRAQLDEIRKELAGIDPAINEATRLEQRIELANLPPDVAAQARLELERLQVLSTASAEYVGIRNYIDWLVSLPWTSDSPPKPDPTSVRQFVDRRFYGQMQAKERLLEFLTLPASARQGGSIPCLIGPPGSGKTLLGRVVARALGRKCFAIDLGLLRSETTLKGNRRTFPGAMPGRFLRMLADVATNSPVCLLEQVDQLSDTDRPDLSGIILEAIDPSENSAFVDFYLGVPYDLSQVTFVATATSDDAVPELLADRMQFIELPGYLEDEKIEIAFQHLIPQLIELHALSEEDVSFTIGAIRKIIREYTLESGLAGLKKNLEVIFRRLAADRSLRRRPYTRVNVGAVEKLLGTPVFIPEMAELRPETGVAAGLAWTHTGGDIMMIEALRMSGSGTVYTTGYLGDIMKESIQAAHSYVRSRADMLGIKPRDFTKYDVHIHFPSGAIPKDGPSAGITVCLVLASVMSNRPIRHDVAFTGEVSLRGKVLPVGGLREKIAAAHRTGINTIVFPKQNVKDLKEIPRGISKSMKYLPVEHVDEVFQIALLDYDPAQQSLENLLRQELAKALDRERKKPAKKARKKVASKGRSKK